jgi:hypothetical protein
MLEYVRKPIFTGLAYLDDEWLPGVALQLSEVSSLFEQMHVEIDIEFFLFRIDRVLRSAYLRTRVKNSIYCFKLFYVYRLGQFVRLKVPGHTKLIQNLKIAFGLVVSNRPVHERIYNQKPLR